MSKTFSSKSNASRAARKAGLPGDAISQSDSGVWIVTYPASVEDGIDGPVIDDVPVVHVDAVECAHADPVLLAAEDGDFGLCTLADSSKMAQDLADSEQLTITVRDPVTDEVLGTFQPSPVMPAAVAAIEEVIFSPAPVVLALVPPTPVAAVAVMVLAITVASENAVTLAQELATRYGIDVEVKNPITGNVLQTVQPVLKAGKAAKAPRVAGEKIVRAPRAAKTAPDGMGAKIIALCLRDDGATPKELNDLTQWKGAPWKWLLSNRKATGLADRFGYELTVSKDGGAATYLMRKVAA